MIAELPHEVSRPEHVLEEFVYRGPSRRVVAGDCAELHFCCLRHESRAEDFLPFGACGAQRSHP